MQPKVLIGVPTCDWYDYCLDEFILSLKNLDYENKEVLFVDNSKEEQHAKDLKTRNLKVERIPYYESPRDRMMHSRNLVRERALEGGYDYLLMLDQDVIIPSNTLKQLLSHDKKVITGIYYSIYTIEGKGSLMPVLWKEEDESKQLMKFFTVTEVEQPQLVKARACGTGVLLIHRDVLEQIKFRYTFDVDTADDMWFCHDLKQKGIQLYADTSVKCIHKVMHRIKNRDEWKKRRKI